MRSDDDMHKTLGKRKRPMPQEQLEVLRNRLARAHNDRKSGAAIERQMVKITTAALKREIRDDRRAERKTS
jgi:hypothetical protein